MTMFERRVSTRPLTQEQAYAMVSAICAASGMEIAPEFRAAAVGKALAAVLMLNWDAFEIITAEFNDMVNDAEHKRRFAEFDAIQQGDQAPD